MCGGGGSVRNNDHARQHPRNTLSSESMHRAQPHVHYISRALPGTGCAQKEAQHCVYYSRKRGRKGTDLFLGNYVGSPGHGHEQRPLTKVPTLT